MTLAMDNQIGHKAIYYCALKQPNYIIIITWHHHRHTRCMRILLIKATILSAINPSSQHMV